MVILLGVFPGHFFRGKRCTSEGSAIVSLRAIQMAQVLYREGDKDGNGICEYASSLTQLVNTGPSGSEDLIDEALAGGRKQGYAFEMTRCAPGVWTATASPIAPGTTGDRFFGINMKGELFFRSEEPVRFLPNGSSPDARWDR